MSAEDSKSQTAKYLEIEEIRINMLVEENRANDLAEMKCGSS